MLRSLGLRFARSTLVKSVPGRGVRFFRRATPTAMPGLVKGVTAVEAAELVQRGVKYLDVRTPEEFAAGHAEGAVNIPLSFRAAEGMVPNPKFAEQVVEQFPDKQAQLVVGCKSGNRSTRACSVLTEEYANLFNAVQGFDGWMAANLPVMK